MGLLLGGIREMLTRIVYGIYMYIIDNKKAFSQITVADWQHLEYATSKKKSLIRIMLIAWFVIKCFIINN